LLPTLFALAQFESFRIALLVLVCLTIVQFIIGSYLEPVFTGSTLSISPFAVMFVVFLWSMLWGLTGAFIGVPILVAAMAVCRQIPSMRWFTVMLSGGKG
jgi:predicted PurR-regulated permease PerM